ncbi:uncharacterized protein HMPREF1541_05121 [Cyphellophora europaea CBS 101466]|uniref:Heterokaryon incompatibility domain-containing protein n=1 Tax=Cyphellophora europaea (strain CBS 101466) TaxID=1220924 RepID=W2RWF5_CYPE1|nr:uncharacterized protein HMPREF1541_05121 [Cyphellophora europaea CBS 101466]ETN40841.1 hypothetical protein HMPREF1541_05121 [Cyphellophora europaea CBS 101466]
MAEGRLETPGNAAICTCGKPTLAPSTLSEYRYKDISNSSGCRIFTLFAGNNDLPLRGTIRETNLSNDAVRLHYDALSYTWTLDAGSSAALTHHSHVSGNLEPHRYAWQEQRKPHLIVIDDHYHVSITCALNAALLSLRSHRGQVDLYVDAVCIDQGASATSLAERSTQLKMMDLIFCKANAVLVFLGDQDDVSERVLSLVVAFANIVQHDFDSTLEQDSALLGSFLSPQNQTALNDSDIWQDLVSLSVKTYWTRVWIIQEMLLPDNVVFCVGERTIERDIMLSGMFRMLNYHNRTHSNRGNAAVVQSRCYHACASFHNLLELKHGHPDLFQKGMPLIELMALTDSFESTVPHDQIYGLLGMARNHDKEQISVNYSEPYASIIFQFSRYVVEDGSLAKLLHLLKPVKSDNCLPSWVLDPRLKDHQDAIDARVLLSPHGQTFRAGGSRPPIVSFRHSGTALTIRGVRLGSIQVCTDCACPTLQDANPNLWSLFGDWYLQARSVWLSHLTQQSDEPGGMLASDSPSINDFWQTLCAGVELRIASISDVVLDELLPTSGQAWDSGINRERFADVRSGSGSTWPGWEGQAINFRNYSSWISQGRKFCITSEGRLGLVPGFSQPGDELVGFVGCPTLYAGRSSGNGYRFVGSAYLHGLMDGSALSRSYEQSGITLC